MRFTCALVAVTLGLCLTTLTMAADESDGHAATAADDSHGGEASHDGGHEANTNPLSFDPDLALC